MSTIRDYIGAARQIADRIPCEAVERVADVLYTAYRAHKQIFVIGNGGSGATASHFAQDLGKGTIRASVPSEQRFRVVSLTDNTPYILALSNDLGYETIFVQQLMNLAGAGDVLVAFSGSGNSRNVLEAVRYAQQHGLVTVGFTGFDGGKLRDMVEYSIHVPCEVMEQVEDTHLVMCHALVKHFQDLFGTPVRNTAATRRVRSGPSRLAATPAGQ